MYNFILRRSVKINFLIIQYNTYIIISANASPRNSIQISKYICSLPLQISAAPNYLAPDLAPLGRKLQNLGIKVFDVKESLSFIAQI